MLTLTFVDAHPGICIYLTPRVKEPALQWYPVFSRDNGMLTSDGAALPSWASGITASGLGTQMFFLSNCSGNFSPKHSKTSRNSFLGVS